MSKRVSHDSRIQRSKRRGQKSGLAVKVPPRGPLTKSAGIPYRFRARLGYNEQFTASPASGSSDGYVISIQSMYDPRFASGGHQPQYFDQLAALWTYFVVRKVRIRLTIAPDNDPLVSGTSSNTVYQAAGMITPFTSTTGTRPSSAASDMLEWPGGVTRPITTGGVPTTLTLEIDIAKFLGISWPFYRSNPAFWGTNGGNPSTMMIFAWVGAIAQGAGQPLPSLCQATVEYDAEFFCPVTLATS